MEQGNLLHKGQKVFRSKDPLKKHVSPGVFVRSQGLLGQIWGTVVYGVTPGLRHDLRELELWRELLG